jgi:hypothetical protein
MSTITLRATKGSPLTNTEVDNNFSNLNTDKIESTYAGAMNSLTGGTSIVTLGTITTGTWSGTVIGAAKGGTGVANNAASTLTISGAYGTTLTVSATTALTLPTTGTLATLAGAESLTNKKLGSLTSNGIVTTSGSDGTLSVTATTGSGSVVLASSPSLTTPTLGVATATSINKVAFTAPATSATLTIADGASLITAGAFSVTLTATGATTVTLPTSGTLATTAVATLSSLTSIGTIGTGTWQATDIGLAYGGTNATLTADAGAVVYSTASAMAFSAVGSSGQLLQSNGTSAPSWVTPTYASTGKAIAMALVFGF